MTLRLNEPTEGEKILEPLVDVRFGCNMIQIRCCSDSGNAFIELLKYSLADGDLQTMQQNTEASRSSTPIEKKRTSLPIRMVSDGTVHESQSTKDEVNFRSKTIPRIHCIRLISIFSGNRSNSAIS